MIDLICENCRESFEGRPNRKHCSVKCRRDLARKRKFWDRKFTHVRFCEIQASWDTLTDEQRANWQEKADFEREKQLKIWGPRP